MDSIFFTKLSGAGNDFIIIDNTEGRLNRTDVTFTRLIKSICRRRMSVGADGVVLLEKTDSVDFRMYYFNADGSKGEICGNGVRCAARYAYIQGIAPQQMRFLTDVGVCEAEVMGEGVKVRMSDLTNIKLNISVRVQDQTYAAHFLDSGVPHVVLFVEDIHEQDVVGIGRCIRYHDDFKPQGTNVDFVSVQSRNSITIRTYERGVEDETLACGTGAIASVGAATLLGSVVSPVSIKTASGSVLKVSFMRKGDEISEVFLEGDARIIYEGRCMVDAWQY